MSVCSRKLKIFFAFCRKWLKVAQKNSLRSRGVLGLTIESFQKVTKIQNDGNHPKPHTVIPNTFGTQGTKMIQGNIICSQILMLWSKPSFFWPRRILLFSLHTSLFDSQLLNVYRVFFCLQLEISLSVSGPASKRRTHFLWCKFFFFFSPRETKRKD